MTGVDLPRFIKPLPAHVGRTELEYLHYQDAFTFPNQRMQDRLFQCYVDFVHAEFPVVEVHEVIAMLEEGGRNNGKISLLLYWAMIFAASAFLECSEIRNLGYGSYK